jgi:SAM-dependent methyltransferase
VRDVRARRSRGAPAVDALPDGRPAVAWRRFGDNAAMDAVAFKPAVVDDELAVLRSLVPLQGLEVVELGCGSAELARRLVTSGAHCRVVALEVDERQHAKNLAHPGAGLTFVRAGAQHIPFEASRFDVALMLKSLHHVPLEMMDAALSEVHRVLKPGGLLYVSEPVFAGDLNDVIRLFHDEQVVRAAAYAALGRAMADGRWDPVGEITFDIPVAFQDFADFDRRIVQVTFADHRLDAELQRRTRLAFERHMGPDGARFLRPMRVNWLRKRPLAG